MSSPDSSSSLKPSDPCPCGSGRTLELCCQPVLTGRRRPETAEELMRARFTAHVLHDFKFLHESYRPTAKKPYVAEEGVPAVTWKRLEIHSHEISDHPDRAFVDFTAYGEVNGAEHVLHEKSEFLRVEGAWLYNREMRLGPAPVRSTTPKVGRNDPCPCGSGKKYKHCCLT